MRLAPVQARGRSADRTPAGGEVGAVETGIDHRRATAGRILVGSALLAAALPVWLTGRHLLDPFCAGRGNGDLHLMHREVLARLADGQLRHLQEMTGCRSGDRATVQWLPKGAAAAGLTVFAALGWRPLSVGALKAYPDRTQGYSKTFGDRTIEVAYFPIDHVFQAIVLR